jgi:hypothetical protein
MHILNGLGQQRINLLTNGYTPAYVIMGRETYLQLRNETQGMLHGHWTPRTTFVNANDGIAPITETVMDIIIVVDHTQDYYLRVVPRPFHAVTMPSLDRTN